jgi:serine/threonine protein kinase
MTAKKMLLLMEYAEGGTVRELVADEARYSALETGDKLRMLSQIAWAMASLYKHDPPILHRDLKSANVLLDSNGKCLLADFGLAKKLTEFTETYSVRSPWQSQSSSTCLTLLWFIYRFTARR